MWSGAFGSAVPMVTSKRLNLALAWLLNVFAFIIIFISLVMLGLLIFIVPNANIVGREYDQQGVSWFFLILYGAIATSCLIYFLSSYNEHRRSQCEK
jgi:hypothetical protein